jgi:hypothetical protein
MKPAKAKRAPRDPVDGQVNVDSLRYLDTGKYFKRKAAEHRYVQLDADVYKDFKTAKEVNEALRVVQQLRRLERSMKKKTA